MSSRIRSVVRGTLALTVLAAMGCADGAGPSSGVQPSGTSLQAVKFWEATASTRWNRRAMDLLVLRAPGNGQAAAARVFTYLSLAQYRAVLAAEKGKVQSAHPAVAAAVGGASAAVLSALFPLDVATIEGQLDADLAAPQWPGATHEDPVSGEEIGRAVGADIVTLAANDNYLVVSPGVPPVGQGYWVSSAAPIVRALTGVRPFHLESSDQLRPPPPPAFGSAAFLAGLAEVRAISDTRTDEQLAIARLHNTPFTPGALNQVAVDLIRDHHRTEREAARILAVGNVAVFDAMIACFDAKFAYWFIRPSQADAAITLPIGLPNHPSYPSGHSCLTSAMMMVLADAFPSERERVEAYTMEAGLSRVYGGIHYRFDIEAGQAIGRGAAALALAARRD